jgi:hypothetical protein
VFSAAQSAALGPSRETPSIVPDSSSRPADIFIPNWSRGRPAALDIHVISPMQQHVVERAAVTAGHALHIGVPRKLASHLSACRDVGVDFVPVVFETVGGAAGDSISIVRAIGRAIGQRSSSQDYSVATKQLFSRIAVMHLSIACPTTPWTGKGGGKVGI